MVNPEEASASSEPEAADAAPIPAIPDRSAGSAIPAAPQASASTSTRPRQIAGRYPVREVVYYQFSTSDIRSIGVAQATATIFAALGTFALSIYFDFGKDITLVTSEGQRAPQFLYDIKDMALYAWILFWALAAFAFIYQNTELKRIKAEHGEPTFRIRIKNWWARRGAR